MSASEGALEAAKSFFDAVENQDWSRLEGLCAPDFKVWHCYDGGEYPAQWMLSMLPALRKAVPDLKYAKRRYSLGDASVTQQHCVEGTTHDGRPVCIPVTMHVHVDDWGRVRRLEEYADSGQLQLLRDAIASLGAALPPHPEN